MSKHTPGPWIVWHNVVLPKRNFESDQLGAIAQGMQCTITPCDTKESEANARLIAAAPELLEALQGLFRAVTMQSEGATAHNLRKAAAALAKAEGREE